jgi:hypothetical protein
MANLLNFLKLYETQSGRTHYCASVDPRERKGEVTFPDAGPEYIAVVDVHHYPLTVQWVFVDGAVG